MWEVGRRGSSILESLVKTMAFILSKMRSQWRILNRVAWSNTFKRLTAGEREGEKEAGKGREKNVLGWGEVEVTKRLLRNLICGLSFSLCLKSFLHKGYFRLCLQRGFSLSMWNLKKEWVNGLQCVLRRHLKIMITKHFFLSVHCCDMSSGHHPLSGERWKGGYAE